MMRMIRIIVILIPVLVSSISCLELEDEYKEEEAEFGKENSGTPLTFVLSARNLPSKDHHSPSDPFVELYSQTEGKEKTENRFGTTPHIMDDENPDWHKVFYFPWTKGTGQKLRFVVRDHDFLQTDDTVAEVTLDMDDYVNIHNQNVKLNLTNGGQLHVKKTTPIYFRLSANEIPNKDGQSGKSDPYVVIWWREGLKGRNLYLRRTSYIKNHHNPNFISDLIVYPNWQKGKGQYLYFQVWDKDHIVKDDLIGDVLLNVDEFVTGGVIKTIKLENSNDKATLSIVPV